MTAVVLIRHAEAHYRNSDGSYAPDGGLTSRGMTQAHALADAVRGMQPSLVIASPMLRTRQTASVAGLNATLCDDLVEWHYRPYEQALAHGRPEADDPWWIWTQATRHQPHEPETLRQLGERVDELIRTVTDTVGADGEAVLVSHGHLLRVMAARWIGLPPITAAHLQIRPASVGRLVADGANRSIAAWNVPCGCAAEGRGDPWPAVGAVRSPLVPGQGLSRASRIMTVNCRNPGNGATDARHSNPRRS